MPNVNLKQLISDGKQVVASVGKDFESIGNAIGKGNVSIGVGQNGISISGNFNELLQRKISGNSIKSPLASLYRSGGGKVNNPIIFPMDIDDQNYMVYHVMERQRPNRTTLGDKRAIRSIVLPIPNELKISYGAEYANEELGLFGAMAAGMVGAADLQGAGRDISNLISNKISAATEALQSNDLDAGVSALGAAAPAIATGVAGSVAGPLAGLLALGGTSGGVVSGIQVSEGLAINPHMAVLFKGVGFREHAFSYRLVARNQTESRRIQQLVNVFKYHMHPSYFAGNLAFKYPEEFEIEFSKTLAPNLFKIGTCVLKSFDVNYNGEGTPLFFEQTGAPVVIDISMSFQETKIVTKDDMDDPNQESYNEQMLDYT
jgi:hypothetical protein